MDEPLAHPELIFHNLNTAESASHHVLVSLLTYAVFLLSLYNAYFDPLTLAAPRSLLLAVAIVPLSVVVTRYVGRGMFHYQAIEVLPFLNPGPKMEYFIAAVLALLAWRSRNSGGWKKGVVLRQFPFWTAMVRIMAMTPLYVDQKLQAGATLWMARLDGLVFAGMTFWGGGYALLLVYRSGRWVVGCLAALGYAIRRMFGR